MRREVIDMQYLKGKDYDNLCKMCQRAIDDCLTIVSIGPDTDDTEAPYMFAADNGFLCGGRTCAGGLTPGQVCKWHGYYREQIVVLRVFHRRGGFWLAEDVVGGEVYPDAEDLETVSESLAPVWAKEAARRLLEGGSHEV